MLSSQTNIKWLPLCQRKYWTILIAYPGSQVNRTPYHQYSFHSYFVVKNSDLMEVSIIADFILFLYYWNILFKRLCQVIFDFLLICKVSNTSTKLIYILLILTVNLEGGQECQYGLDWLKIVLPLIRVKIEWWYFLTFPKYIHRSC